MEANIRRALSVILSVMGFLAIAAMVWLWPIVTDSVLFFLLGFAAVLFAFSPIYAVRSANAYEKAKEENSRRGLWFVVFKLRKPNRLYQRDKGDRPVDFVGLIPPGRNFAGEINPGQYSKDQEEYWQLEETPGDREHHPGVEVHKFWIVRLWVWYINLFYDVALVGIKSLIKVHWYPIEKTRYKKAQREALGGGRETIYEVILPASPETPELSDHVRIAPFDWVVAVDGAETTDRLSWNMLLVVNMQSHNPWLQLNNHENWSRFLSNAITDAAVRGLRKLTIDDIMMLATEEDGGSQGDEARDKIIASILAINERLYKIIGLRFANTAETESKEYSGDVQILSIEPRFRNEEDRKAFTQKWRAEQQAQEERILGDAEAYRESKVIGEVAEKVQEHGEAGALVQRMQALENAAKTGKSTIVFDTGSGNTSNIEKLLALQLEERLEGRAARKPEEKENT